MPARALLLFSLCCLFAPHQAVRAQEAPRRDAEDPENPGFTRWFERELGGVVRDALDDGVTPGLAVAVGHGGHVYLRGFGDVGGSEATSVTPETLFDLASVTKVAATAVAVMILVEEGRLDLDAPLSEYLPAWPGTGPASGVTQRLLLSHRAGLRAGAPVGRLGADRADRVRAIAERAFEGMPGGREVYSDLGPILVAYAIEEVTGEPLADFLERRVFRPLGMTRTVFNPLQVGIPARQIVATQTLGDGPLRGTVHDPVARSLGGVAGNAGLFATARDLATLASALLWERPARVVCRDVLRELTRASEPGGRFAMGWERPRARTYWRELFSPVAFGHTGFTGTSFWIDPEQDVFVVILASRLAGTASDSRFRRLRRELLTVVRRGILRPSTRGQPEWRSFLDEFRTPDGCRAEQGRAAFERVPAAWLWPW